MALKKLYKSQYFDFSGWSKDKTFLVVGSKEWREYLDGQPTDHVLGTSVEVVIIEDNTDYQVKDGETVTNLYEKFWIKVSKQIDVPLRAHVVPEGVTATVYGEYMNQLSVKAANLSIVGGSDKNKDAS